MSDIDARVVPVVFCAQTQEAETFIKQPLASLTVFARD